jgi:tetratricopeptide (TPR) repeat protein
VKLFLFMHIAAGYLAVMAGYAALFAPKGKTLHRRAGLLFAGAMILMGLGATIVGLQRDLITWTGGISVAYLVITATLTVRRKGDERSPLLDGALLIIPTVLAVRALNGGIVALSEPGRQIQGIPAPAMFMSAIAMTLAATGDVRILLRGPLRGSQRISRHLWRMCYALFSATGSFFLIEKRVPEFMRFTPLRLLLAFLPMVMLVFWLWRVRRRRAAPAHPALAHAAALAMMTLLPVALAAQPAAQARALFERGRYSEARVALQAMETSNPKDASAAYLLGRIALEEGNGDVAIRYLERAVEWDDQSAEHHLWLGFALGDAATRVNKLKLPFLARRVKSEWERAVSLDPANLDARAALATLYVRAPGFMGGSGTKAREQASALAKLNPRRGALARADIARHEKNWRAEVEAYEQAIAMAPDSVAAYVGLADGHVRAGRPDSAFATVARYQALHPSEAWGHYAAGRIAGTTGQRLDEGERSLQRFLATPPADLSAPALARVHYWNGKIAQARGNTANARAHYERALATNARNRLAQAALEGLK